jgi:uncharacterized protein (DUF433 family)
MDHAEENRVTLDPKVMVGKPVIRGTRIPVELIVRMLAQGIPEADILQEYPNLRPEDIRAALDYAARPNTSQLRHEEPNPGAARSGLKAGHPAA